MKEFVIFVCTDSTEIFFSKLSSVALNYNLSSFFTDSFCAGVSNKHCLLTFFIVFTCVTLAKAGLVVCPLRPSICASICLQHFWGA